jgi:hypothetical protein
MVNIFNVGYHFTPKDIKEEDGIVLFFYMDF